MTWLDPVITSHTSVVVFMHCLATAASLATWAAS